MFKEGVSKFCFCFSHFFETSSVYIFLLTVNETNTNILVSGPTVEGFGSVSSRPRVPRSVSPGTQDIGTGGLDLALIGGDPLQC